MCVNIAHVESFRSCSSSWREVLYKTKDCRARDLAKARALLLFLFGGFASRKVHIVFLGLSDIGQAASLAPLMGSLAASAPPRAFERIQSITSLRSYRTDPCSRYQRGPRPNSRCFCHVRRPMPVIVSSSASETKRRSSGASCGSRVRDFFIARTEYSHFDL
jgi:hypothetical protein